MNIKISIFFKINQVLRGKKAWLLDRTSKWSVHNHRHFLMQEIRLFKDMLNHENKEWYCYENINLLQIINNIPGDIKDVICKFNDCFFFQCLLYILSLFLLCCVVYCYVEPFYNRTYLDIKIQSWKYFIAEYCLSWIVKKKDGEPCYKWTCLTLYFKSEIFHCNKIFIINNNKNTMVSHVTKGHICIPFQQNTLLQYNTYYK